MSALIGKVALVIMDKGSTRQLVAGVSLSLKGTNRDPDSNTTVVQTPVSYGTQLFPFFGHKFSFWIH